MYVAKSALCDLAQAQNIDKTTTRSPRVQNTNQARYERKYSFFFGLMETGVCFFFCQILL